MCREQLPVWQSFYQRFQSRGVGLLSVAMDAQGPEKARPFVERARATFPTVVDQENLLGELIGFKAIPNGLLLDELGILQYKKLGDFDIRKPEYRSLVERWAEGSIVPEELADQMGQEPGLGLEHHEALGLYRQGLVLYRQGRTREAVALWCRGIALAPDNYIIRKQVWAVEHPERFYAGAVDYPWQREQLERGL